MTTRQQEAIDDIMDNFDFNEVHRVMSFLNWQWQDKGVPDISELKRTARRLLKDSINKKTSIGTGGFEATYEIDSNLIDVLNLKFVLTYWEWHEDID